MSTIFAKIINGEVPAYIVAEDDEYMAFLDVFPIRRGHTLVIPKKVATDKFFELDDKTYTNLFPFGKKVAEGIKKVIPCNRICMAVAGFEVPHAHLHLIPANHLDDLLWSNPKKKFTDAEFKQIAIAIKSEITL